MTETQIRQIIKLLESEYGKPHWRPSHDPLSVLVQTILSQNTSDANSWPAFDRLRSTFRSWEELASADVGDIESAIRTSGLGRIKATRIRQALKEIIQSRGALDLDFLAELPVDEAGEWLKQLPGVGDKTANCVLLFALGRPALPVDTHIFRVAARLGLLPPRATLQEAHKILGKMVSGKDVYDFHVLTIGHGRKTCTAQRPSCPRCALRRICPSYEKFVGHPATG